MSIRWLRERWTKRRAARCTILLTEEAFRRTYPAKRLLRGWSRILHVTSEGTLVQLCNDWGGKPPHRTWWLVAENGACREMSFDEANSLRPVPLWR